MTCSVRTSSQLCFKQGYHLASAYGVSGSVLFILCYCEYGVHGYSRFFFFFFKVDDSFTPSSACQFPRYTSYLQKLM